MTFFQDKIFILRVITKVFGIYERRKGINNTRFQQSQQTPKFAKHRADMLRKKRKRDEEHQNKTQKHLTQKTAHNRRDKLAIGAYLHVERPSGTPVTSGEVIRITCAQLSHFPVTHRSRRTHNSDVK